MKSFQFYQPTKIHFGPGTLNTIGKIASKYGESCLLVTTRKDEEALAPLYKRVIMLLEGVGVRVHHFDEVVPNPTISSIEEAIDVVNREKIPFIIPVGGGSSIDTAKSISLFAGAGNVDWQEVFGYYTDPFAEYPLPGKTPLPIVSVTTTSGTGSQLTQAMVISNPDKDEKMCIFHDQVFSKETIIDPELMTTLPPQLTAVTGFDAFSHSFESFLNDISSPYSMMVAEESIKTIIENLPKVLVSGDSLKLRSKIAYADMLSGIALTNAAASIPHPLSEIIGGVTPRIPHGLCLAVVYPEYINFIWKDKIEKCARIAKLFDPDLEGMEDYEAASKLEELVLKFLEKIGLNKTLSDLGVTKDELCRMEQSFLLDVLPFASRDVLFSMIKNRF